MTKHMKNASKSILSAITMILLTTSLKIYWIKKLNLQINKFNENVLAYCFRIYNYEFIEVDLNNKFVIGYSGHYDYYPIVEFLLKIGKVSLNEHK